MLFQLVSITLWFMAPPAGSELTWVDARGWGMQDFTETYKVNQITGRVMQHEVAWSFGRTGAPAAAYFTATRTAYSTKQAAVDLSEAAETLLAAEENPNKDFQGDPNDPMKVRCQLSV